MALDRFRSQVWSAVLLSSLKKALVYASPIVTNRNYEGEIKKAGDIVRITSIGRPTTNTYTPGTAITRGKVVDAQQSLVVDQFKYFNFEIDDVDAAQAAGNAMTEAMEEAAFGMADVADQFVAALYTGAQTANTIASTSLGTPAQAALASSPADSTAYDLLVDLGTKLDEANVPTQGRYSVVPPWVHALLLKDPNFINAEKSGTDEALRNGVVGRAGGFQILKSNNAPTPSGTTWIVQAGVPGAITYASQLQKTEAYRPQDAFSDAVKTLNVYGAKLIRPDAIAVATVTKFS